jgi:hypothetical protein
MIRPVCASNMPDCALQFDRDFAESAGVYIFNFWRTLLLVTVLAIVLWWLVRIFVYGVSWS